MDGELGRAVGGGATTYGWRKGGVPLADGPSGTGATISGAGTAVLGISNCQLGDGGAYDCIVSNACAGLTSNAATLTLLPVCPADLDDGTGTGTPDGGVDINDLLFFLAHYESGC